MRARIAGVTIEVGPDSELSAGERTLLLRADQPLGGERTGTAVQVRLRQKDDPLTGTPAPAQIGWDHSSVTLSHPRFEATIGLSGWDTEIIRSRSDTFPLRITLRALIASILPFRGALPLHAAGIILDRGGVICFGQSGAGKTTIAGAASTGVVSDELTVASALDDALFATGLLENDKAGSQMPLRALIELDRGPTFSLEPLSPLESLRTLLRSIMVPAAPLLWRKVTPVAAELVRTTPIYRLRWSPGEPVWDLIATALDSHSLPAQPIEPNLNPIRETARSCA